MEWARVLVRYGYVRIVVMLGATVDINELPGVHP